MLQIAGVVVIGYLVLVGLVYAGQSKMLYHPDRELWATPRAIGLDFKDVELTTSDDVRIHGWWIPKSDSRGTVLFCHGNAGNISGRLETIGLLHDLGLQVMIFDYRGYGKSSGSPNEKGTYRDARAAWDWLIEQQGLDSGSIFLMGRSLGGPIAAKLAAEVQPGALVLESTFTSAADLGQQLYPFLPVRWLLKHRYPTRTFLKDYEGPVWVAHSPEDGLVPFEHGRKLYEAAADPKTFLELEGSHGEAFLETGQRYREALSQFITQALGDR